MQIDIIISVESLVVYRQYTRATEYHSIRQGEAFGPVLNNLSQDFNLENTWLSERQRIQRFEIASHEKWRQ